MEYKSQKYGSKQCGQACLAMITGMSINEVCNLLGKSETTNFLTDLKPFLQEQGYETHYLKVRTFDQIPNNSIVLLEFPNEKDAEKGHFCIKFRNQYYDPAVGIIKKYEPSNRLPHSYLKFTKN